MTDNSCSDSSCTNDTEEKPPGVELYFGGSSFKELDGNELPNTSTVDEVYYACNVCNQWHSTMTSLQIHFLEHFNECPTCEVCGETFTIARDYADHCVQHVGHTCIVCEKVFFSQSDFVSHHLEHKLQCIYCKAKFLNEKELKDHYESEHDKLKFQCNICFRYYQSNRKLSIHKRSLHVKNPRLFKCHKCELTFTQMANLKTHISRVHDHKKPYVCDICHRGFSYKTSLKTHMYHHSGEKPYMCLICCRSFAGKRNFHRHGYKHLPDQSYQCDICFETLTSKPQYELHRHNHLSEDRYKCEVCSKAYKYSSHLKRHVQTHTNERPFSCQVCGSTFYEKRHLLSHLRNVHSFTEENVQDVNFSLKNEKNFLLALKQGMV